SAAWGRFSRIACTALPMLICLDSVCASIIPVNEFQQALQRSYRSTCSIVRPASGFPLIVNGLTTLEGTHVSQRSTSRDTFNPLLAPPCLARTFKHIGGV